MKSIVNSALALRCWYRWLCCAAPFACLLLALAAPAWAGLTVNGNATVTDSTTSLVWDQCPYGLTGASCATGTAFHGNWAGALDAAVAANTASYKGFTDWRVPNRNELESIAKIDSYTSGQPAIDTTAFPGTPLDFFWTSTTRAPFPSFAWIVNFDDGSSSTSNKTNANYVRLVRSGQSFASFDVLPDTLPDVFTFTAQSGVALGSTATSNSITVAGVDAGTAISISGGTYSINSGGYVSAPGTVSNGDTVTVRQTASSSNGTLTTATLTIGLRSAGFDVTTTAISSQTITFANPGAQTFGTTPTLTATASSGLTPTFTSATTGVCTITSGGVLTFVTTGTCTINADQSGNGSYSAATQVAHSFSVGQATQAVLTAASTSTTPTFGTTTTLSTTGGSGTGAVSYASNSANCTISDTTLTAAAAGACTVTATKAADANYTTATATVNITVGQASQAALTASATNTTPTFGTTTTLSTTGGSGTGAVSYASNSANCTISGTTLTAAAVGACTVTATKEADANYTAAATATVNITVGKASQAALTASATNTTPALGTTTTLSTTGGGGTGAVSYASNSANCTISGTTLTAAAVGACTVTVTKAADANYTAATATVNITVGKASQTLTFAPTSPLSFWGAPITLTANSTSGLTSFTFSTSSSSTICTVSGSTLTFIGLGVCSITAAQAGDANYVNGSANANVVIVAYTINTDGTATDPKTGLIWMRCSMGQTWDGTTCNGTASTYTFDQANALTGTVTFAGQSDWRMPNIRELQTIVDRSVYFPAIDSATFPNTPSSYFWSNTPTAYSSSSAWTVIFSYGGIYDYDRNHGNGAVRLVRSGQSFGSLMGITRPAIDYVDNGNGTVTHTPTNLTWKRCTEGQTWNGSTCSGTTKTYTYDQANALTGTVPFAGQSDWRLPTEDELLSLEDYSTFNPAINPSIFPATPGSDFWSGSPYAYNSYLAWYVNFGSGGAYYYGRGGNGAVRLVRGGQSFGSFVLAVSKSGTGSGSVTSSPAGIGCGSTCSATLSSGSSVTLTATPTTGSTFTGWSGACSGTSMCVVSMSAAQNVTATFTQSVTAPACILSASPTTITVGSSATLTASCTPAATSYTWTGGSCAGTTGATCTVTPTATTTYTVTGTNAGGTGAVANAAVTVNACTYELAASSTSVAASASTGNVSVTSSCVWTATSNASWISVISGASGSGNGTVAYTVAANTGTAARTDTLTIAGKTYTVTQAGVTTAAPVCTLIANPAAITTGGGSTLTASCTPVASSYTWTGGTCTGTTGATCTVTPTATTTHTVAGTNAGGTGTAASATVTVNAVCSPALDATSASVAATASTGSVNVTSSCAWTATSDASWLSITSGASGNGNGTVAYAVTANTATTTRTGTLTIGSKTFTVTQQAGTTGGAPVCTLSANPSSITAGGSSTLTAKCDPMATGYIWTGGTCAGTSAATCTVSPTATTTYSVQGSNTSGTNQAATATVTVAASTTSYTVPGTLGNDVFVLTAGNNYYGGAGNDTFIISASTLRGDVTAKIIDTEGDNLIQLVDGVTVTASAFYTDAAQLTLSTGAKVQLLGASKFKFQVGANAPAGDTATVLSYADFVSSLGASLTSGTLPASGTAGYVVPTGFTQASAPVPNVAGSSYTVPSTLGDDIFVLSAGNSYLGGGGNDTYIISPYTLSGAVTAKIIDSEGSNVIQLVKGLTIASSSFFANDVQLTLSNGAKVQVLGASGFSYQLGANAPAGETASSLTYAQFAATLGASVPTGTSAVSGSVNFVVQSSGQ